MQRNVLVRNGACGSSVPGWLFFFVLVARLDGGVARGHADELALSANCLNVRSSEGCYRSWLAVPMRRVTLAAR